MTKDEIAEKLFWPLWRAVDNDYKRKYANNIWDQFEQRMRSSAYTSKLDLFFNKVQRSLPITGDGLQREFLKGIEEVLNCGEDKDILNMIRSQTSAIVLRVRVLNDKRNADYKAAEAEWEELEKANAEAKDFFDKLKNDKE